MRSSIHSCLLDGVQGGAERFGGDPIRITVHAVFVGGCCNVIGAIGGGTIRIEGTDVAMLPSLGFVPGQHCWDYIGPECCIGKASAFGGEGT
eukprot:9819379-Ditylum_brightwellii.AAC.1